MLKTDLIHPEILRILGTAGHHAKILIAEFVMPLVEEFAAETPDAKEGAGA